MSKPDVQRDEWVHSQEVYTMDIRTDPLVNEIKDLAPNVSIVGGTFAHCLPAPKKVPQAERSSVLERVRRDATGKCLTALLMAAGLPAIEPGHLPSGARDWPAGYTGSVSHKGTKVVTALTRIGKLRSVGIDVETLDGGRELSDIKGLIAADELPLTLGTMGSVILLSVKEAVYKALNPVLGIRFGYEEIQISWKDIARQRMSGVAHFDRITVDVRCSTAVPRWVGSVALVRPQPGLPSPHV